MPKHEFLESLPLYALDALTGSEKERLEAHLRAGCEICEPELRLFQETGSRLPYALPNHPLPGALKEKVWDRIQAEAPPAKARRSFAAPLAVAAALAIAMVSGWWFWQMNQHITAQKVQVAELQQLLLEQKEEIEWLRDPSVQLALLTGLDPLPQAKAKMLWNPNVSRGLFYVSSLPPLSQEKSYQLWVIGNAGPVSAGTFYPASDGSAVITISRIEGTATGSLQFAVTIEPRGGRPKPTGSMVLAGKPL